MGKVIVSITGVSRRRGGIVRGPRSKTKYSFGVIYSGSPQNHEVILWGEGKGRVQARPFNLFGVPV